MYQFSGELQPAEFDNLFKGIITDGWAERSDGHVESPQGYFAVVEIPAPGGELTEMGDALGWEQYQPVPKSGWYLTIENSDGLIYVYRATSAEVHKAFDDLAERFARWEAE